MKKREIINSVLFFLEVLSFVMAGNVMMLGQYIFSFLYLLLGSIVAYILGNRLIEEGKLIQMGLLD